MEYKITQIRKYGKGIFQSENIGTQFYSVVYAHLYLPGDTNRISPIKVHFIHMFDSDDLYEFFNPDGENGKEVFTQEDIKLCRNEFIFAATESLFSGNDIKQIIEDCNNIIGRYA